MTEFRNQEELNKALNIYRRAMCDFIFEYLRRKVRGETAEDLIGRIVNRKPSNLEPKHISQIFGHRECRNLFKQRFGYSQLDDRDKYDIESVTALITMGRNIVYHYAGTTDLDSEFTRAYLFLIADILGKIDNPDAKREVEDIRNNLFFPNAAYKENLADITKQLETANAEKPNLSPSGARKPQSVGFLSVFCLTCHLWKGLSLVLLLSVLGVSVQPNLREDTVFS